ncbi:MAG: VCBS repeat-containing protein [Chitinophagaceae bacterium]|nr:VCBS repeat-containing protein [Chitinophagaceae bacterium]
MRYLFLLLVIGAGCRDVPQRMFTQLLSKECGVSFVNTIHETDSFNVLKFEYMYNGGGLAVCDLNGDGLVDLFFAGNQVPGKLFLNEGKMKFKDVTEQAGVAGRQGWKTGATIADVNGDGLPDIYVCYSGIGPKKERSNQLFINGGMRNGVPFFEDKALEYGISGDGSNSTQAAFFDYDHDGDLDMFLLNHGTMFYNPFVNTARLRSLRHPLFGNKLFRNDPVNGKIHFTEVSEAAGIKGGGNNFGLGVAVSDVNNDGWPDVYVTNDYEEQDFLYLNNKDGTFKDITKESISHITRFGMGVDIADYNNDGLQDIAVMDMNPKDNYRQKLLRGADDYDKYQLLVSNGYYHQNMRNMLQLNVGIEPGGNPVYSEIGQLAGISNTDWSWAPLFADFDNDGWKDLYITNGVWKDLTDMDFIKYGKIGMSGVFDASSLTKLINKMPATRLGNYMFGNNKNGGFINQTANWGLFQPSVSSSVAYADLDNDGDLDLIVNNLGEPSELWENHARQLPGAGHYIDIILKSKSLNTFCFGAKVTATTRSGLQVQEMSPTRGYQSSVDFRLHFGLGSDTTIKIDIQWPYGGTTTLHNVKADERLVINEYERQNINAISSSASAGKIFESDTENSGLDFVQRENAYVDTKTQSLLPWQISRQGPKMSKADVNGDGLEDVFVGAPYGQPAVLFIQEKNGHFVRSVSQPWIQDSLSEDIGSCFFDADQDGDYDLYVVSGGSEPHGNDGEMQDRLYLNDRNGNFSKVPGALPVFSGSRSCPVPIDYDNDGDLDLFVGGYSQPGHFPEASKSYLLRNDSQKSRLLFTEMETAGHALGTVGMVTQAVSIDINEDGWADLLVAGDWMPLKLFINEKGKFKDASISYGLENTEGLWEKILPADIDGDGDLDFVVGALAPNTQLKAMAEEPMRIYVNDFDKNGTSDPVLCYYLDGENYPYPSLDELAGQIPVVRKKFLHYRDYANATAADVFTQPVLDRSAVVKVVKMNSIFLVNDGRGKFSVRDLPFEAQFSAVFGILADDFDRDGKQDLLLSGNFYPFRVQLGREDAGNGLLLKGNGKGNYLPLVYHDTGLLINGDVRDMIMITDSKKEKKIVVSKNSNSMQLIKVK